MLASRINDDRKFTIGFVDGTGDQWAEDGGGFGYTAGQSSALILDTSGNLSLWKDHSNNEIGQFYGDISGQNLFINSQTGDISGADVSFNDASFNDIVPDYLWIQYIQLQLIFWRYTFTGTSFVGVNLGQQVMEH